AIREVRRMRSRTRRRTGIDRTGRAIVLLLASVSACGGDDTQSGASPGAPEAGSDASAPVDAGSPKEAGASDAVPGTSLDGQEAETGATSPDGAIEAPAETDSAPNLDARVDAGSLDAGVEGSDTREDAVVPAPDAPLGPVHVIFVTS